MPMTISEIFDDTCNFFSKKIKNIFFICLFVSFFAMFVDSYTELETYTVPVEKIENFISKNFLLDFMSNIDEEEKTSLFKYSVCKVFESLVNKTVLLGAIIIFISNVSNNKKNSIKSFFYSLFSFFPGLFLLNCITAFFTQLGFSLFFILGVFLSIMFSLSPIIFSSKKYNLLKSIQLSISISWENMKIIAPAVLIWMCSKLFTESLMFSMSFFDKNMVFLLFNTSMNMLYSFFIIYLFRFYMLFSHS